MPPSMLLGTRNYNYEKEFIENLTLDHNKKDSYYGKKRI
jgi:hypothetical protein